MSPQKARNGTAWLPYFVLLACLTGMPARATTELFVGGQAGLALYGFDPVAFFIDHSPRQGLSAFELTHEGAIFRFRNEGNRAAFKASPDTYLPRYGGYDPIAVGRGAPAPGLPRLYVIREERLYFFSTEKNREMFLASPREALAAAEVAWPQVMRGLVQH